MFVSVPFMLFLTLVSNKCASTMAMHKRDQAGAVDWASMLGTWFAVLLALVALVSIVGQLLIWKTWRVERQHALNNVHDGHLDYVKPVFRFTNKLAIYRVRVPLLNQRLSLDLDQAPKHSPLSCKKVITAPEGTSLAPLDTGWVNLARLLHFYVDLPATGDPLLICHGEAWLPVQRFYLLAAGLRGRYGHRTDRGESLSTITRARLFSEVGNGSIDAAYVDSTTANKLYGTTGIMWWRQSLDPKEMLQDEVYFSPQLSTLKKADLDDPTPLQDLFWLALGCLPISPPNTARMFYDLHPGPDDAFSPYMSRSLQRTGNRAYKLREAMSSRHRQWTNALDIDPADAIRVYYCNDNDFATRQPQVANNLRPPYRLRPYDIDAIALGVLGLQLSRHGLLTDPKKTLSGVMPKQTMGNLGVGGRAGPWRALGCCLQDERLRKLVAELCQNIWLCSDWSGFSRARAQLCWQIDNCIELPDEGHQRTAYYCVALLAITNRDLSKWIETLFAGTKAVAKAAANTAQALGLSEQEAAVAVTTAIREAEEEDDFVLQLTSGNLVELGGLQYNLSTELFPHQEAPIRLPGRQTLLRWVLKAHVHVMWLNNYIDSGPLLDTVDKMSDIVHVSSRTVAPPLPRQASSREGYPYPLQRINSPFFRPVQQAGFGNYGHLNTRLHRDYGRGGSKVSFQGNETWTLVDDDDDGDDDDDSHNGDARSS